MTELCCYPAHYVRLPVSTSKGEGNEERNSGQTYWDLQSRGEVLPERTETKLCHFFLSNEKTEDLLFLLIQMKFIY